jgi:hypothetical protein
MKARTSSREIASIVSGWRRAARKSANSPTASVELLTVRCARRDDALGRVLKGHLIASELQ